MAKRGSPHGTRKGLKRKYFFTALRQKRLERKARFPVRSAGNAPGFF
jgi:hypothetical protein